MFIFNGSYSELVCCGLGFSSSERRPVIESTASAGRRYPASLMVTFFRQRSLKMAYFCCMVLKRKRWAKLRRCESLYFLKPACTRQSRSAGGRFDPPPKKMSYSIFSRRRLSSSSVSSSSTVKVASNTLFHVGTAAQGVKV